MLYIYVSTSGFFRSQKNSARKSLGSAILDHFFYPDVAVYCDM